MKMKLHLLPLIILALFLVALASFAGAENSPLRFHFEEREIVYYVGNTNIVKAILNNPSQLTSTTIVQLMDQNGTVLAEASMKAKQKNVTFRIAWTKKQAGKHLAYVAINGEKLSDELYIAVGDKKARIMTGIKTDEKVMSLSMDFSYGKPDTEAYFRLFDEYGIKITCFFTGRYVEGNSDMVRFIRDGGHDICNHSLTHPHNKGLDLHKRYVQIVRSQEIFRNLIGVSPAMYRPPFGEYSQDIKAFALAEGMTTTMWSIDSQDWDSARSEDWIFTHVSKRVDPGCVILFHNDGIHTLAVLKRLIPWCLENGYCFVPISELMTLGEWR